MKEKDIEAVAEDYLDLWISHVSKQNLMPWVIGGDSGDLSSAAGPEIEGLYRQWEAYYHQILGRNDFSTFMIPTPPHESTREHDAEDRSQDLPSSASVSPDVSPDELAELKARLGALAKQISEIESNARDSGKNDAGDNK